MCYFSSASFYQHYVFEFHPYCVSQDLLSFLFFYLLPSCYHSCDTGPTHPLRSWVGSRLKNVFWMSKSHTYINKPYSPFLPLEKHAESTFWVSYLINHTHINQSMDSLTYSFSHCIIVSYTIIWKILRWSSHGLYLQIVIMKPRDTQQGCLLQPGMWSGGECQKILQKGGDFWDGVWGIG